MDKLAEALVREKIRRRLPAPSVRRLLREQAGITQQVVADTIGVTREAVARWEGGTRSPRGRALPDYVALLERLARESV